jgi:hypothetical protein
MYSRAKWRHIHNGNVAKAAKGSGRQQWLKAGSGRQWCWLSSRVSAVAQCVQPWHVCCAMSLTALLTATINAAADGRLPGLHLE